MVQRQQQIAQALSQHLEVLANKASGLSAPYIMPIYQKY